MTHCLSSPNRTKKRHPSPQSESRARVHFMWDLSKEESKEHSPQQQQPQQEQEEKEHSNHDSILSSCTTKTNSTSTSVVSRTAMASACSFLQLPSTSACIMTSNRRRRRNRNDPTNHGHDAVKTSLSLPSVNKIHSNGEMNMTQDETCLTTISTKDNNPNLIQKNFSDKDPKQASNIKQDKVFSKYVVILKQPGDDDDEIIMKTKEHPPPIQKNSIFTQNKSVTPKKLTAVTKLGRYKSTTSRMISKSSSTQRHIPSSKSTQSFQVTSSSSSSCSSAVRTDTGAGTVTGSTPRNMSSAHRPRTSSPSNAQTIPNATNISHRRNRYHNKSDASMQNLEDEVSLSSSSSSSLSSSWEDENFKMPDDFIETLFDSNGRFVGFG